MDVFSSSVELWRLRKILARERLETKDLYDRRAVDGRDSIEL